MKSIAFILALTLVGALVLSACSSAEPEVIEKEVIKEVEVVKEVEVIKEVEVVKEVVKTEIVVATPAPASTMMIDEEDKYGGTLRVVSQASIKSLDPDFCTSYVCWQPTAGPMIESLFAQGADFSTPAAAG